TVLGVVPALGGCAAPGLVVACVLGAVAFPVGEAGGASGGGAPLACHACPPCVGAVFPSLARACPLVVGVLPGWGSVWHAGRGQGQVLHLLRPTLPGGASACERPGRLGRAFEWTRSTLLK